MTPTPTLLEALAQFLRSDVQPRVTGATAWDTRIAVNLLGILAREAAFAGRVQALEAHAAQALGLDAQDPSRDLARGLRDGRITPSAEVLAYCRERTLLALAIDNPGYSGYREACARWQVTPGDTDPAA